MAKKRGSAIVIAVLLVSAIGTLAFSFGRLFILESANANLYENGIGAYYSAESGIEEGFLRYRYDRDAEVPFNDWTVGDNKIFRSDLTGAVTNTGDTEKKGISKTDPVELAKINSSKQFFDLRMGSKTSFLAPSQVSDAESQIANAFTGYTSAANVPADNLIKRDESKKFDLTGVFAEDDANFLFKAVGNNASPSATPLNQDRCALIQAKITGNVPGGSMQERKVVFYNSACNYGSMFDTSADGTIAYVSGGDPYVKIANIKSRIWPTSLQNATLFVKPIGADIAFMVQKDASVTADLVGANNVVTSTGFYGGVARTLEANIDRQSGTAYDLFDYVIYKAN